MSRIQTVLKRIGGLIVRAFNGGWRQWRDTDWQPANGSALINIVQRSHYKERIIWLPMSDAKAVRQAVKLERAALPNAVVLVDEAVNGKTPVTIFELSEHIELKTGFWVPESLLFGLDLREQQAVRVKGDGQDVLVGRTRSGLVSQIACGMFANERYFCAAYGLQAESVPDYERSRLTLFSESWWRLPLKHWQGLFITGSRTERDLVPLLKQAVIPFLLLGTLYVVGSYGWTGLKLTLVEQELSEQQQQVSEALTLRNHMRALQSSSSQLNQAADKANSNWLLWQALLPIYESNLGTIDRIEVAPSEWFVTVKSKSSNAVLSALLDSPLVNSAKFDGPVRTMRGDEIVRISLELIEGAKDE